MADEYQFSALVYDFILSRPLRPIRNSISSFILSHKHKRIIDVCCGTGEQLRLLEGNSLQLTGIDISESMLKQARKKSHNIKYIKTDWSLPLKEPLTPEVDCAIITFGLHEKRQQVYNQLFINTLKAVKPGGHILLCDFCRVKEGFTSQLIGHYCIPAIERLAGQEHFAHYRHWMKSGALEGFCRHHNLNCQTLSYHFKKCVCLYMIQK